MGHSRVALALTVVLLAGCFGYNPSSKRWAYVGDSLLLAGGGAAIAVDVTTTSTPCTGPGCPAYTSPFGGALVTGVILATAGLVGILLNATRASVKTSR